MLMQGKATPSSETIATDTLPKTRPKATDLQGQHLLYGPFMGKLSAAIFEWDKQDYQELLGAKKEELQAKGVKPPTNDAAAKVISKDELAKYCRRRTRGNDITVKALEELILSSTGCTHTLGEPLFKMEEQYLNVKQNKLLVYKILMCLCILKCVPLKRKKDVTGVSLCMR